MLPQPSPDELQAIKPSVSGTGTFRLMVSAAYAPAKHAGNAVEVRGLLIRQPAESRINITSLETIGPDCVP